MHPTPTSAIAGTGCDEPPVAPALLEDLLIQLDKAVRARQIYSANNPTYRNALQKLRASCASVWDATDSFTLDVTDTQFRCCGVVVHEQATRASDSLPWLCYKDGLRELTLSRGVEGDELEALIDIIPKVRRAQAGDDDLVSLLWEREFAHLAYRYVEASEEGVSSLTTAPEPGRYDAGAGSAAVDPRAAVAEARATAVARPETLRERTGVVKLEDFDPTLYFLDEKEVEYIKDEVEREYRADLRLAVLDSLCDVFELHPDVDVRNEVLRLQDQMLLTLLSNGQFQTVAHLLRQSKAMVTQATELDPLHRYRLLARPNRLSEPETLSQILQQLDETTEMPSQEDLDALFGELQPQALETIFGWLDRIRSPQLRTLLRVAAERIAAANTGELVRVIAEAHGAAALEAIRRAGALKTPAAVAPLARLLGDPDRDVRLAAVKALVEIGSGGAMQMLERALTDTDREIRLVAVRTLGSRGQRAALSRIEAIVRAKELREQDLTERMAFFVAYGELCGDGGIPFLDGILHGKSGLLARREDPEIRACAAMALGRVKSPPAMASLQQATADKDVVVRNAVNRALRGGET
jgi:hypothetical protein